MVAIASLALLLLSCTSPQDPGDVLAHYQLRGKPATVTRTDVALEMAFHLRRRDRGREASEVLIDTLITRREAERLGQMPSDAEVRQFWQKLQNELRAAGQQPEDFAAFRNSSEQQWLRDLSVSIAQERLVRRELGLRTDEKISGDMVKLWLAEAKKRLDVVTDPGRLAAGTAARVGSTSVLLIDLGMLLLRTSEDDERDRFIHQVAYLQSIEALAADSSVQVTPADLDAAIERRRQDALRDPRFRGVKFENLLEAQGMTVESLRELRVFRSEVLLEKLTAQRFPDATLRTQLIEQRDQLLARIGPRRRIGAIFVRALADPNALVVRTFDMAQKHLEVVRRRISTDGFAATASIESEDGESKQNGGDVGWHRADSDELPAEVVKAAFALPLAEVSQPIRTADGCYLVTVLDQEPMPDEAELLRRLLTLRGQELREQLLRDCKVEIVGSDDKSNRDKGNGDKDDRAPR